MGIGEAAIDTVYRYYYYAAAKFRTPRRVPPYLVTELEGYGVPDNIFAKWDLEKAQQMALKLSWVYGNIMRVANEVASAQFNVFERGTNEKNIDHDFEALLEYPNQWFSGNQLIRFLVWALMLDEWGAFWWLAPDSRNSNIIREIWPIPIGRVRPVKHKDKFISHYLYTPKSATDKKMRLDPKYVVNVRFPHPNDIYKSLTPLEAASLAMNVYQGIETFQRDLYTKGRGTPLSVLSVDPNINEPDFEIVKATIQEDWANERRIAVVPAGSLEVKSVGLSSRDLTIIESLDANRDEIDSVFMGGIPWRSKSQSAEGIREVNKMIKESVIWPLHKLIAAHWYIQIIKPFYGEQFRGKFDDIRAQDRSILLQERNVYFRHYSYDEARQELGKPPIDIPDFPGLGDLPVPLATNPSFVAGLYGIGPVAPPKANSDDVGNMPEQQDESMLTNQLARGGTREGTLIDVKAAINEGIKADLKNYQKVLLRTWRKHEDAEMLVNRTFDTDVIFPEIMDDIKERLSLVQSEEDIKAIFAQLLD